MDSQNRIILIIGMMGTGKTSKAIQLVQNLLRVETLKLICVNPHEDKRFPISLTELEKCPCDDERRATQSITHKPLCLAALENTVVLIDEIGYNQSPHFIPRQMREFIFKARIRNNYLIATTQRMRDHNHLLVANVAEWYIFRSKSPSDLDAIRDIPNLGDSVARIAPTLPNLQCICVRS